MPRGPDGSRGGAQDGLTAQVIIVGAKVIGFFWRGEYLDAQSPKFSSNGDRLTFSFPGGPKKVIECENIDQKYSHIQWLCSRLELQAAPVGLSLESPSPPAESTKRLMYQILKLDHCCPVKVDLAGRNLL
jgi:hypothetical protein